MPEANKLYGLDEQIDLPGRITTIREQKQAGKAREMQLSQGGDLKKNPLRHWVTIEDHTGNVQESVSRKLTSKSFGANPKGAP